MKLLSAALNVCFSVILPYFAAVANDTKFQADGSRLDGKGAAGVGPCRAMCAAAKTRRHRQGKTITVAEQGAPMEDCGAPFRVTFPRANDPAKPTSSAWKFHGLLRAEHAAGNPARHNVGRRGNPYNIYARTSQVTQRLMRRVSPSVVGLRLDAGSCWAATAPTT